MSQHVLKMLPACSDWTALYLIFIVKTMLRSQLRTLHPGSLLIFVLYCSGRLLGLPWFILQVILLCDDSFWTTLGPS